MGTEHILLGLLREGDGVAARVFKNFNVSLDQTRQTVSKELDSNSSPTGGKHSTKNRLKLLLNSTKVRKLDIQESSPESLSNFTPRAQQVLALARKEADRFNHNFAGTEHLLLGLIKLGQGVAVNVLAKLGLDLETVCKEIEKQVGTGPDQKLIGNIPYTPRVKKVLALAAKEAKALNHTYVGTEHILLGLLREGDGVAARVLKNLHVDIKQTRNEILKELDPNFDQNQDNKLQEPPSEHMLNFSPHAQQLLGLAHKEADRFNHNFVGTEHVLLGMIKLGQGVGFKVLLRLGLDVETIRLEIEKEIGTGTEQKTIGNIPYTPQLKKVLSLAVKEARALSHTYVGTEHILLGLIREGDSFTAKMLNNLDITFEETRQEILKELDIRLAQAPDVQPQSDASKLAAQPIPATSPAPTFSLEHIGLPALDPTALKDWYISVLDAKLVFENGQTPPAYFLKLPGGVMLEIYQAEASPAETANNGLAGWRHLALRVEAIEPARDALEKKGVQFPDPIKPAGGGGRVLFFRDPAQNLLHLVERPSGSLFR
jgi:ATP-dependent Clp protease ATP-binding subunit ClpA